MKRRGMSLALCAAMAMGTIGVVPAMADDVTTITYWVNDRHDSEYMTEMVEKYNKENTDNIYIDMQIITDDYENMISLAYTGGTAPDIIGQSVTLKNFVDNDMLVPLNDYIDADEEYQKVNEPYEHAYEGLNYMDGNLYWVYSGMRSGVRIEYNKDLLEKSGYTEIEMMAQVSGIYYYDYVNGKFDFSGYKEILEKGKRFIDEEIAYPDQQGVDNMRALFAEGEFALWGNASQEAGVFTSQLPIEDFEWGVAEVPSLDGEIKGALQTTPSKGYAIMSSSEHPDEAWKVIQYFQSEEFLKGYLENGYCLPITSYMDEKIDKSKIGRLADFSLLDYESVYPAVPTINLTGDDYRTVMWNAIMGYVDVDDAIEDLNTRYNEAYDADIESGSVKRLVIEDYDPLHPSDGTATYLDK